MKRGLVEVKGEEGEKHLQTKWHRQEGPLARATGSLRWSLEKPQAELAAQFPRAWELPTVCGLGLEAAGLSQGSRKQQAITDVLVWKMLMH